MEHLGADADLCAKAKLKAVRKSGRCVDIDRGGIHLIEELFRMFMIGRQNAVAVSGSVLVDVGDRLVNGIYGPYSEFQCQIFTVPVLFRCGNGLRNQSAECLIGMKLHSGKTFRNHRSKNREGVPVNQQRFQCVANPGTLAFRIFNNIACPVEIAGLIDEDMTDSLVVLDDRHGCLFHDRADQTLAAPRDHQIDELVHFQHLGNGVMSGPRDHLNGSLRHSRLRSCLGNDLCQSEVGMNGFRAAAEDDRVSGFQAESGCIDRHIGSGFINQCDHADGNGDFFNIQPIGPPEFRESVTDRIRKSDDMPESVGDSLNAFFIQAESIQHGGRDSGFLSVFHINAVCVQDGFCLRIESVGHGREPLIFLFGGRRCEFSGSVFCGTSHFLKSLSDFFD